MDYIQQAYKGLYDSWRYIVGFIIICIAWQFIGAIPLIIALLIKVLNGAEMATTISGMAELLGNNFCLLYTSDAADE